MIHLPTRAALILVGTVMTVLFILGVYAVAIAYPVVVVLGGVGWMLYFIASGRYRALLADRAPGALAPHDA